MSTDQEEADMKKCRGGFLVGDKEQREWENSLDGIYYNLQVWGDASLGTEKGTHLIVETLSKLPRRVRDRVLENVTFVVFASGQLGTGTVYQFTRSSKETKKLGDDYFVTVKLPLIFLNFVGMNKKSKRYQMSTIAHEIAHYVLGHFNKGGTSHSGKDEKGTDDLIEKWGFARSYKSYEPLRGK